MHGDRLFRVVGSLPKEWLAPVERPRKTFMESTVGQKRLMAILLTDVVNFSDRAGKNEEATLRQLEQDLGLVREECGRHGGEVFKSTGDGILAGFLSSNQALEAAQKIQSGLIQARGPLSHRIGIHVGDVCRQEKDVLGDGVNLAARLTEIAEPAGICVSETVHHSTRSRHGGFQIHPVRGRVRNAPRDFRAYHFRPISLLEVYRPTLAGFLRSFLILALGASFFLSPTVVGLEALSPGNFQPEPFFLAGLSIAQYPAGFFLGFAWWGSQGSRPGREALRRMAMGFSAYAGLAGWLLSLLATSQNPPLIAWVWHWLFGLQATVAIACWWTIGWSGSRRGAWIGVIFCLFTFSGQAELQPSLESFHQDWGAPVQRGSDRLGQWQDFKKSRERARVWIDRQKVVLQIEYRLPDYDACWTKDRLGQTADLASPEASPRKIGLWERDYAPPFRSATPRFSTEYWARREPAGRDFSAHAVVANELTSLWMLPPFVIFVPFTTDLSRPISLTIRTRNGLSKLVTSSGSSIAEARRKYRP